MEHDAKIVWRLPRKDKRKLIQLAKDERLTLSAFLRNKVVLPYVKE
ncbi:MAG: hypothetical protein ACON43_00505 [Flavobacteriaceae bacterium]